ncbi:hypothetical protein INR49_011347 [Caranx melampygus]|nr:hypothetical protein INR49_011347 [Caranx melampygus]
MIGKDKCCKKFITCPSHVKGCTVASCFLTIPGCVCSKQMMSWLEGSLCIYLQCTDTDNRRSQEEQ